MEETLFLGTQPLKPVGEELLEPVRQREVNGSIAGKPIEREVKRVLGRLKNKGRKRAILPEMLKAGARNEDFVSMLTELMTVVWENRCVPYEWTDAILIPIPKKGNFRCFDNWRGIALLDVVGKLAVRIVQNRLRSIPERELPESQCGFR